MPSRKTPVASEALPAFVDGSNDVQVVVETPRGSRNKFKLDAATGFYKLNHVLPAGMVFPYDFGFVPSTLGEDGDPLDVLLLMDEPTFVGCQLEARLVGVIEARQSEEGESFRNDRLIAVATEAQAFRRIRKISDLDPRLLKQIERFFAEYNEQRGKKFEPLARHGPRTARKLVVDGAKRAASRTRRSRGRARRTR
jgi:inorganic pyrophosphatase